MEALACTALAQPPLRLQTGVVPETSTFLRSRRWTKTVPFVLALGGFVKNHPDRAWDAELGCQCGAGMPCRCNGGDEPDISEVITEENKTTKH